MSEKPRRRREDGAVDFHGGPRDGDRIVVEGNPTIFDLPVLVEAEGAQKAQEIGVRYEFRDGAYFYLGQVGELGDKG